MSSDELPQAIKNALLYTWGAWLMLSLLGGIIALGAALGMGIDTNVALTSLPIWLQFPLKSFLVSVVTPIALAVLAVAAFIVIIFLTLVSDVLKAAVSAWKSVLREYTEVDD